MAKSKRSQALKEQLARNKSEREIKREANKYFIKLELSRQKKRYDKLMNTDFSMKGKLERINKSVKRLKALSRRESPVQPKTVEISRSKDVRFSML